MAAFPQIVVTDAESMAAAIRQFGIIPLFVNSIPGYSIEELTPEGYCAFDGPEGIISSPWDWKVSCVQMGEFAYGKFLLGGKAAFATVDWYRELRAWRLSQPKYRPNAAGKKVLEKIAADGDITIKGVRELLGIKKSQADALLMRLQMACRVITGDIQRVYRGPYLEYKGWQSATFCTPEDLFDTSGIDELLNIKSDPKRILDTGHSAKESYRMLSEHIHTIVPGITDRQLTRLLG